MSSSAEDPNYNDHIAQPARLFERERPLHAVLGGGKVADLLLWRNPKVSFLVLTGVTFMWILFEVVKYNLVTFVCHVLVTTMLVFFIWCTLADIFKWNIPRGVPFALDESTMEGVATVLYKSSNRFLSKFLDIAAGRDSKSFFLVIGILWFMSILGNYISTLNLLYIGYILIQTMPFLYEMYEADVDNLSGKLFREIMMLYMTLDSSILRRIPRGPRREKKRS